jgi:hypothetical protein
MIKYNSVECAISLISAALGAGPMKKQNNFGQILAFNSLAARQINLAVL